MKALHRHACAGRHLTRLNMYNISLTNFKGNPVLLRHIFLREIPACAGMTARNFLPVKIIQTYLQIFSVALPIAYISFAH